MPNAKLFQADFRECLAKAKDVDLVVTSPPYCDARTYGAEVSFEMKDYQDLGDAIFQALKPGGHCLLNLDAPVREWRKGVGTERGFMPWKVMLDWAERIGFRVPDRLAFGRQGLPGAYYGRFRNDWEPLFWFQKPGAEGYFCKEPLAEASTYSMVTVTPRARARDSMGLQHARKATGWAVENDKKQRGTLWDYGHVGKGHTTASDIEAAGHPARFPFTLASDCVLCFSPPDGLVCDPFLGGGTSLIAAFHHRRNFIGGDLLARKDGTPWIQVARDIAYKRWKAGTLEMFGTEDFQIDCSFDNPSMIGGY